MVIGPQWIVNSIDTVQIINMRFSATQRAMGMDLVYREAGKVMVAYEGWTLDPTGKKLEASNHPEIGFEVENYVRCE